MQKKLKHLHPVKRWRKLSLMHKAISVFSALAVITLGLIGFAQIQDSRNEQFIRDAVAEFDKLELKLEKFTGVEVEDVSSCFTTSEKFNDGKTGCFLKLESDRTRTDKNNEEIVLDTAVDTLSLESVDKFREGGYRAVYKDSDCVVSLNPEKLDIFSIECPIPIRQGNSDIIVELGL